MKVFNSLFLLISSVGTFSSSHVNSKQHSCPTELYAKQDVSEQSMDRRSMLSNSSAFAMAMGIGLSYPSDANAQPDCMSDCLKNCKLIAPKDTGYCLENCKSYCAQEDRTDGLSGSVSSDGGEVGILGRSTVVKGEDKPPSLSLPGLDFSSEKGRKLIGY